MTLNFNSSPHYDDFEIGNKFYRILFKPGRAVQARELSQIQSMIQNQITQFGNNIFKEGSIVLQSQQYIDYFYKYVKLAVGSDGIAPNLVGHTISGETSGVSAIVLDYRSSTTTDPTTLFVKYLNSGSDNETFSFTDGEDIVSEEDSSTVTVASSNATGNGTAFSIAEGVIYTKGHFVYHEPQTLIVSKYDGGESQTFSKIVGFVITESIIDENDDSSLLDPALGASNYLAPGADRYVIDLSLEARDFTPISSDDENFIELIRIEDGQLIGQRINPEYNIINDTLARRTFDESGNYVVKPYALELIEHLKTSNTSIRDGYLAESDGGNTDLFVSIISPGKSYVLGYENENLKTRYVTASKARDSVSVNNGFVATEPGNYVFITSLYSIPDLITLQRVSLYNRFTSSDGSASGTLVGTARIRDIEHHSGSGLTAIYKAFLIDIQMNSGYSFEEDVKQLYFDNTGFVDFTANISPINISLTGTVTTTNSSNIILGNGTRFGDEIESGDYVTINGNLILIDNIVNDITAISSIPVVGNISGIGISLVQSEIEDTDRISYIFEMPYQYIKSVNSDGLEANYTVKRVYDRTLSDGNVSITAGTDEVFAPYSLSNYAVINKTDGEYIDLEGTVTRTGTPTGKTINFELGIGYGSDDVRIITTVQKSNSSSVAKNKTLVEDFTVDYTSNTTATAASISLTRADVLTVASISMSANAFGTAYTESNAIDITHRYDVDNGQRITHYDIGRIILKKGQPKPTGPIRVTFDYFTHSSGDYFSVESYGDIDYADIPSFTYGNKTYQLRDCLDFRPRIDTNGLTFTSPSEFPDVETDFITDYEYYLPRTDKLVIDSTGTIKVIRGISSLNPVEPITPQNSMALYVLKQDPYVFNARENITVVPIDNRRYTMRDIGRIENRVKNLEYYTTLSLLEKDTASFQIKDELGFDRFKNGFLVDNFTGHRVGDASNPDYRISMDIENGIIRPAFKQKFARLIELAEPAERAGLNYQVTGNLASLPFTHELFIENAAASRTENINPFSVVNWIGTLELDPPSDIWYDEEREPDIYIDVEGNYNTLLDEFVRSSKSKAVTPLATGVENPPRYGTIWGSWSTIYSGSTRYEQERSGTKFTLIETIDTTTNNDVIINKVVIPKMRSVDITFTARGMKPNTRLHVFFNDLKVTDFCTGSSFNAEEDTGEEIGNVFADYTVNRGNVYTDISGTAVGTFRYDSEYFNFQNGEYSFRVTDSVTNGNDSETSAETVFKTSGELRTIRDEIISTRNGELTNEAVYDRRSVAIPQNKTPSNGSPGTSPTIPPTIAEAVIGYATNYQASQGQAASFVSSGQAAAVKTAMNTVSSAERTTIATYMNSSTGTIDGQGIIAAVNNGSYVPSAATLAAYNANYQAIEKAVNTLSVSVKSPEYYHALLATGGDKNQAIAILATNATAGLLIPNATVSTTTAAWAGYQGAVISNPNNATNQTSSAATSTINSARQCWSMDPLAQTFVIAGNPIVLSKVDLFFFAKDNNIPMFVEIRKVVNGNPSQIVIPFSRVTVYPESINISDDGQTATTIEFAAPVYLEPGEYCIVLLSSSINYRVWISEVGENDVFTSRRISTQPFVGVLFKSQNASTWTADQLQDLKFKLYRADFDTSLRGTIDFYIDKAVFQYTTLPFDPLEAYPGSDVLKVYHPSHGMSEGSLTTLSGFPSDVLAYPPVGNVFGVNVTTINNVEFPIANVHPNFYTITMPASSNVEVVTRGGLSVIQATQDYEYDAYHPVVSSIEVSGTTVEYQCKTVDTGYVSRNFVPIEKTVQEFGTAKILANDINTDAFLSGGDTFLFRLILSSDSPFVSPLIDMQQMGGLFIKNMINNPSYESEHVGMDIVTIVENNDIYFTNLSEDNGLISIVDTIDMANVASVIAGTLINVSGTGDNDGQFRVIEILDSGANIRVYGDITTEAAGNTVTITNGLAFVAEEAPVGGSAQAKYITKPIDFINPSTSINIRLDVSRPEGTNVKLYYKTRLIGESTAIEDKEFIEIAGDTIRTSIGGEFYEIERQLNNLPQFSSLIIKVVLLSDDSALIPKCSNLRVIALA